MLYSIAENGLHLAFELTVGKPPLLIHWGIAP